MEIVAAPLHAPEDIEAVMAKFGREANAGLILLPDTLTTSYSKSIVELAARHRMPAIYAFRLFVEAGGTNVLRSRPRRSISTGGDIC